MTSNEIMFCVVDVLEQLNIPYVLVGSYSSNVYGIPRSTEDADFVAELAAVDVNAIAARLDSELHLDPQMQLETITGTSRYIITHSSSSFKVELFVLSDDPHHRELFRRRRRADVHGRTAWILSAEDVIIQKLRWYARAKRPKDLEDVKDVMDVQGSSLDLSYIRQWCEHHGSREHFEKLLANSVRRGTP